MEALQANGEVVASLGMFLRELQRAVAIEVARTTTVNLLTRGQVFYLLICRRADR